MSAEERAKALFFDALDCFDAGDFGGAERQLREVLTLVPERGSVLRNLAGAIMQQGRPAEAVAFAERAVALDGEDADALVTMQALASDRIIGVETGGCPHTAIREDASINLRAIDELNSRHPGLDVIFIESGGDNLAATFSPDLADLSLYVISVCQGGDIPRKGGPAITRSDLLIINKVDLAPHVGVDLDRMRDDAQKARAGRPLLFTDLRRGEGVGEIVDALRRMGGL